MSGDGVLSRVWREARRRRLPSTLVGYPVACWFVIESVPNVLHNLGASQATMDRVGSTITIVALAAFPLVLLLTWMFQVVPQDEAMEPERANTQVPRVTRLITAGGETSGAVVEGLGLTDLAIGPEIDPGVPALRARPDLVVALKSGNFGAEDFFEKADRMLEAKP